MRKLAAELFGTFALVFAGTGAVVVNDVSHGTVSHVGIALTFGLIVLAMIYAVGDVSGAHLNPAVTLGFFVARRFEGRWIVPYIASQCLGALLASVALRLMFPTDATLGATLPAGAALQSFAKGCNAATFEFENIPADTVELIAALVPTSPGASALRFTQDRLAEKDLARVFKREVP